MPAYENAKVSTPTKKSNITLLSIPEKLNIA